MTTRRLLAALIAAVLAAPLVSASLSAERLLLRDVNVVDVETSVVIAEQDVSIVDSEITAIGVDLRLRRAQIYDARGQYLIPGLNDLHVHVKRSTKEAQQLFDLLLAHGVTTVLNLDGGSRVLQTRQGIAAGEIRGPTLFTSGPILRGSDEMTEAEGRSAAKRHIDAGYDFVKVYNGISEPGYRGIIDAAREAGVPVIGHAVRSVGLEGALASGQHIAHMEEIVYGYFTWRGRPWPELPEDPDKRLATLLDVTAIPAIAQRVADSGIAVIPNLIAYRQIAPQVEDLASVLKRPELAWMPDSMRRSWEADRNGYANRESPERFAHSLRTTYPFLEQLTLAFQQAGVRLLAGSDVGIPTVVAGQSLHDDLELLVEAGLTPRQALLTATTNAASFLERADVGRIQKGQIADLVVLRENPLEDIRAVREIAAVVVRGELYDREALDALFPASSTP